MPFPWEIVIALTVLIVATLMKAVAMHVFEEDHMLYMLLSGFAIFYIISALAIGWLSPDLAAKASVRSIVQVLMN